MEVAGADAVGVFYNYSGQLSCFDFNMGVNPDTDEDGDFWGYQYCTEQAAPFSKNGGGRPLVTCCVQILSCIELLSPSFMLVILRLVGHCSHRALMLRMS